MTGRQRWSGRRAGERDQAGAARSLASLLPRLTRPALKRRSQAEAALHLDWGTIVGAELASVTRPLRLAFPRVEERREGTLTLAVEPSFAITLQHLEKPLVERINGHFGFRLVERLKLRQQPVAAVARPSKPAIRPPDAALAAALAPRLAEIEDERLRRALEALGQAVAAERKP